jgi:hypothetical protein
VDNVVVSGLTVLIAIVVIEILIRALNSYIGRRSGSPVATPHLPGTAQPQRSQQQQNTDIQQGPAF